MQSDLLNHPGLRGAGLSTGPSRLRTMRFIVSMLVLSPYYALKYLVMCLYTFPVAFLLTLSSAILNPSIIAQEQLDVMRIVLENFQDLFNYTITLTISIAFLVMLLNPLKQVLMVIKTTIDRRFFY